MSALCFPWNDIFLTIRFLKFDGDIVSAQPTVVKAAEPQTTSAKNSSSQSNEQASGTQVQVDAKAQDSATDLVARRRREFNELDRVKADGFSPVYPYIDRRENQSGRLDKRVDEIGAVTTRAADQAWEVTAKLQVKVDAAVSKTSGLDVQSATLRADSVVTRVSNEAGTSTTKPMPSTAQVTQKEGAAMAPRDSASEFQRNEAERLLNARRDLISRSGVELEAVADEINVLHMVLEAESGPDSDKAKGRRAVDYSGVRIANARVKLADARDRVQEALTSLAV